MAATEVQVKLHRAEQVDLVDQHQIGAMETGGVLERLVLALGHRNHHHPQAFAQVVGGGANQVADIFNHQQLQGLQREACGLQLLHAPGDRASLQMAGLAGADLDCGQASSPEPPGVVVGGQIADDHGHRSAGAGARGVSTRVRPGVAWPVAGQPLQQGGLAGARRRKQVHNRELRLGEAAAIGRCLLVVAAQ